MAFPDGRLTLSAFFHQADRPTEPLLDLSGSFDHLTISGSEIRGRHFCPGAKGEPGGFFDVSGSVFADAVILDEPRTGLRYTGILVIDSDLLKVAFGDFGPIAPDLRERWVKFAESLGIKIVGQEQGTWVATKP